jgi:hypothetical protein
LLELETVSRLLELGSVSADAVELSEQPIKNAARVAAKKTMRGDFFCMRELIFI